MKIMIPFLALIPLLLNAADEPAKYRFNWQLPKESRIEMTKTAQVNFFINQRLQRTYEERNIINLTCYEREKDGSKVKGEFSVFTKESTSPVFRFTERNYSDFIITPQGAYRVEDKYFMPNLRHIPVFPDREISIGDSWKAPAELYLNNFSVILGLQLEVTYTFKAIDTYKGVKVAVIGYEFPINKDLSAKQNVAPDLPKRIIGNNQGVLYWDIANQRMIAAADRYSALFGFIVNGQPLTYQFNMDIETQAAVYQPVTEDQKEKEKAELAKAMPEGVTVDTSDKGIVLRMGEVLFDFDSASLKPEARKALDAIIGVVKEKYPDRELLIEGHTDNIGRHEYNMELSDRRAENVAGYLRNGVGHDKLSFRGYGPDRPLNSNANDAERKKNRRVDITIKLK